MGARRPKTGFVTQSKSETLVEFMPATIPAMLASPRSATIAIPAPVAGLETPHVLSRSNKRIRASRQQRGIAGWPPKPIVQVPRLQLLMISSALKRHVAPMSLCPATDCGKHSLGFDFDAPHEADVPKACPAPITKKGAQIIGILIRANDKYLSI